MPDDFMQNAQIDEYEREAEIFYENVCRRTARVFSIQKETYERRPQERERFFQETEEVPF